MTAALVLGGSQVGGAASSTQETPIAERIKGRQIAASSPALDRPERRSVDAATHMQDRDLVFGVSVGGSDRAYPWWVVKNCHVVNDVIEGLPVALSFCEQCTGAAAFSRRLPDGRVLSFEVAGVYNGTIILRDRETHSLWSPFAGRALEGRLAGLKLDRLPLSFTRWDVWAARHPAGEVVWAPAEQRGGHGSWYEPGKWGIVSEMGETLDSWDARFPENMLVHGVEEAGSARCYPLALLQARHGVVNDRLAATPVVVLARGPLEVAAFERVMEGRVLTFRPSSGLQALMQDEETGSDWSGDGVALSGRWQGRSLRRLDGYTVEWHVWSAYHPGAEVYGLPTASPTSRPRVSGLTFPPLTLAALTGERQAVRLPGRLNLVILWSAWCPLCRHELPRVQTLVERHAAEGLSAVGIAIHMPDDAHEVEVVQRFVGRERVSFPMYLVDDAGYDQLDALCRKANGLGLVLPTAFIVDSDGRILSIAAGNGVQSLPGDVDHALRAMGKWGAAAERPDDTGAAGRVSGGR